MGIYSHVYVVQITITFTKVFYRRFEKILDKYGQQMIQDNKFVNILLKFYNILLEQTSNKYSIYRS